jgi:WS/DGAT/MGAT family acyltransferase
MKRLNGMDAMLLYSETPNLHTHTLKVTVIDTSDFNGEFGFEDFRTHLRRKLDVLEPLRYKLIDVPGRFHHPMWLEDCEVDLDYHLRRIQIPAPGGRRELDQVIGEVASTPLDRSRPLWEFHFAEGLAGNRFAVIGKVHHSLADGVASANLLARAMDLTDVTSPDRRAEGTNDITPTSAGLLRVAARDHLRQITELPGLIRTAVVGMTRVHGNVETILIWPSPSTPRPLSSTTWCHRGGDSPALHCLWPTSKRPPLNWTSRSMTLSWQLPLEGCGRCC